MSPRLMLGLVLAATIPLAGCTSAPRPAPAITKPAGPGLRLVAFDTCDQLLTDLRKAAVEAVGPWGFPGSGAYPLAATMRGGALTAMDSAAPVPGPAFSGTNNHESDADEPDIVKTDGVRIVTVQDGILRVVDTTTRKETGKIDLRVRAAQTDLLLAGDHALVLVNPGFSAYRGDFAPGPDGAEVKPSVLLVDLSGAPKVISRYEGEGTLVDARQTGTVARVVLKTTPKIALPESDSFNEEKRVAANRSAVEKAPIDAWLPSWSVTTNGVTTSGRVGCDQVSRPTTFSGASMVTVLTFDVTAGSLGAGDPVSVAADADVVYGTGSSLYLASDERWRMDVWPGRSTKSVTPRTELFRFDLPATGRPTFAAGGAVPGFLVNQYALSEWDGNLRVATTDDRAGSSAIRVLAQNAGELRQVGVVDGLGKGERIYSVRFIGPRGYVVTFKQTDPLYSVDLSNPAAPKVTGSLKITGYSAHLQPVGDGRLVGIGQEVSGAGRAQGTQVSLFDVSDPAAPTRLARQVVPGGQSEAEWDPHALLWWPATQLLVVPMTQFDLSGSGVRPQDSAVALRVTDRGLTEVGKIAQPKVAGAVPTVRRTLVAGNALWTLSDYGLQASDLSTMDRVSWLPN
jgi:uncharacterized secreted protein with C-terminal beta-propeller domain